MASSTLAQTPAIDPPAPTTASNTLALGILLSCALAHLINDLIQSVLPSIYPLLKANYGLTFTQIGLITFAFQITASLLQPWIGFHTDRHPKPYLLPAGMVCTLVGIVLLAFVSQFAALLLASMLIGVGSSTFHPETSRVARLASGGRFGLAQSTFQVGGNAGNAIGPLLVAVLVMPFGQHYVAWFGLFALFAIGVQFGLSRWYRAHLNAAKGRKTGPALHGLSRRRVAFALMVLALLVFSKYVYMASFINYFTFYLIQHFGLSVGGSQLHLFLFLGAVAAGTFFGGPIGDRIGRKAVIWFSILGVAPFTLALPYVDLFWTTVLSMVIGFVLASAFSAIVVYAQELMPGNVGMIAGVFFGLMFGVSAIAAAGLGSLADHRGIEYVYHLCSFMPLLGVLTVLLPATDRPAARVA